ncbi:MAG: AAA family ATPase [Eubacteriales bacterium]
MNIRDAKQEITDTVRAYLKKDETGAYEIPVEKQRPLLLIGPPGIGKTAIVEQAAHECGINLVSYTMTHHTRQSAIGLPYIVKKRYGGKEVSVTEYTMSEIVAAVYDQIEKTGIKEGILFLDEINCVSETLAPTMLQFLQYKTFGTHRVPDGFVIVTAGNPPQYNRSVRDFDVVTWDRVRRIDVEPDFDAWKEYAYRAGVHGAVISYLEIHRDYFYRIRTEVEGRRFVTARGWEDLSRMIRVREELGRPVTEDLVAEYLQDREIAGDFAVYCELYRKYRDQYRVPDILAGSWREMTEKSTAGTGDASDAGDAPDSLKNAPFDEKLSLLSLLLDSLGQDFRAYAEEKDVQKMLFGILKRAKTQAQVQEEAAALREKCEAEAESHMADRTEEREMRLALEALKGLDRELTMAKTRHDGADGDTQEYDRIRAWFAAREEKRQARIRDTDRRLTNCFSFIAETYGEGQEMVLFLSELSGSSYAVTFLRECGNDAYFRYNRLLLLKDRRSELRQEILSLNPS